MIQQLQNCRSYASITDVNMTQASLSQLSILAKLRRILALSRAGMATLFLAHFFPEATAILTKA